MRLHLWGTDFRRGSTELRSRLFCPPAERVQTLRNLLAAGFTDLVPLYTCNRIEFYTTADDYFTDTREKWVRLLQVLGLKEEHYFQGYHFEGKAAFRHLLRVAGSLESLVVGEPQILGQLKEALALVKDNGLPIDPTLDRAFRLAFETAKAVRTETAIGEKPVSVASLGISHLQRLENEYPLRKAVVVGRSDICVLAVQWLKKNRPQIPIVWVNRSPEKIAQLIQSEGTEIISLETFLNNPCDFSHLFTATSAGEVIFSAEWLKRTSEKSLVFDFAQPPDVEKSADLGSRQIIQLEDLKAEADQNAAERSVAVRQAEAFIEASLRRYCQEQKETPLLKEFSAVEPIILDELSAALSDLPEDLHPAIRKWAEKLTKRQFHQSREHLRHCLRHLAEPELGAQES